MKTSAPELNDTDVPLLRVGLCQVYTDQWEVDANLKRLLTSLKDAKKAGAELAITPECVLHGYGATTTENYRNRMLEIAEDLDGEHLRLIRDTAKALSMDVVVGFAERGEKDQIHNSAAYISREGEILSVYRKVHLRRFESLIHGGGQFTPGDSFEVEEREFEYGTCRVGTMICFDREIPESTRCLRSIGAELICCPLATGTSPLRALGNEADNELITRCRAAENEVFIVVVNHAGRYNGGSFAVGPKGETTHQMGPEEGVDVVGLPVATLSAKFHTEPLGWMGWGHRRQDIYDKYLK